MVVAEMSLRKNSFSPNNLYDSTKEKSAIAIVLEFSHIVVLIGYFAIL